MVDANFFVVGQRFLQIKIVNLQQRVHAILVWLFCIHYILSNNLSFI